MFSFLTTAIRILYPGDGTLILRFPVDVFLSIVLGILGVVFAFVCLFLIKAHGFRPGSFFLLAGFLPMAFFLYVVTQSSTLVFSSKDNTLVEEERHFFRTREVTYPIANVEHVEIAEDDGRSHVFYIALRSGDRIPVGGGWTTRSGYFQAANAANEFLARTNGAGPSPNGSSAPPADYEKRLQESLKTFTDKSIEAQKQAHK